MSSISAGTSTGTALVSTGDTTGALVFKTGASATTALTLDATGAIGVGSTPAYGTSGQLLTSGGSAAAPTWSTVTVGPFGTDLSYIDYSLTTSTALTNADDTIRMQAVSLDGISELMILQGTASAHAVVFNTSTNTFGTPVLIRTASLQSIQAISLVKISSSSVLVCSLPTSTTALETVVLTISGSAITVGTPVATTLSATSIMINPNTRLVAVGSSYVLNYYNITGNTPKFRAITVSGSTPSIGSELAYTAGGTLALMHHSYAQSSTILLSFSMTANTTVFALPITVSGTTLTAGTAATVATTGPSFMVTGALSNSRYALYYLNTTGRGAVVSVTGSVASISTAAATMAIVATGPNMQVFGNQAFVLVGNGSGDSLNVITDTAGVATVGTDLAVPYSGTFVGYLAIGKVFFANSTAGNSSYNQYGISAGSAVLEKSFQTVIDSTVITAQGTAFYARPLSGMPQSGSGNSISLRTATGKIAPAANSLKPFSISINGASPANLQQSANPFTAHNDAIFESIAWGLPQATGANTTIQLRKVTLV